MFDLITIGHFSIDFILLPGETKPRRRPGGPPTYTSISARKIGATVSVVSKVGRDFPEAYLKWLRRQGVDLSHLRIDESSKTTSFLIRYYLDKEREMILRSRAPPIYAEDIKELEARAIHISPIANEVPITLIKKAANITLTLSLDPQGLLRRFNSEGKVSLHGIDDLSFLKYIEVFKASEMELKTLTGSRDTLKALRMVRGLGVKVAIATIGGGGAFISFNDRIFYIPAAQSKKFVDPTGAGDSFIGGFLAEYIKGEDVLWCASVGSSAASYVVEGVGPKGFKGRKKIYERSRKVYEGIIEATAQ
ncbi:MAG: PfkB family carbohydrate kinase [Candidatus Bathyarchaeia archaeon]